VKLLLEHAEKQGEIEKLLNAVNDKGERAVDIAKDNVREMLIEEMKKHGLK
jgi:soluble P-type ATPase